MDLTPVGCLINSISRFIHLVNCRVSKSVLGQKDFEVTASVLKHLKPLLDEVVHKKVPLDEIVSRECEELDLTINETREFLENYTPKKSKIVTVLRSKKLVGNIHSSVLEISGALCGLLEPSMCSLELYDTESRIQEFYNCMKPDKLECIKEVVDSLSEGNVPSSEYLMTIVQSLNLSSSEELLNECIALEKERVKAVENRKSDITDHAVELMCHIRNFLIKLDNNFTSIDGIKIPPYFMCPLSLALMLDPVTIDSGQTYERASIQKWMDQGLTTCPRTRLKISHSKFTTNVTIKALIENWCKQNKCKPEEADDADSTPEVTEEEEEEEEEEEDEAEEELRYSPSSEQSPAVSHVREAEEKSDHSSPEHSYVHSRSESASSVASSIDYLPPTSTDSNKNSSLSSTKHYQCSQAHTETVTASCIEELIRDLKSQSTDLQTKAAAELRYLAKHNTENRVIIGNSGAIKPLVSLLTSDSAETQEHAVTALLNLSINENVKTVIAEMGASEPLIHVLRAGNPVAKENAAAAIFSISLLEEYRIKIGRSGAVKALVDLLGSGSMRGKKDAATALFNLSIYHENKARIIQAGAVRQLVSFLEPETEMVDKAVALLANLATTPEGCLAIAREEGIPPLVEIVEMGSQRGKENAASILLQLCLSSLKYCRLVLQEGAVPPLVALSQSGTTRAKEKAQQLLGHFRNQREGAMNRGKS
ncbi:unnamed protein product [Cuscuta europaea]|uniref:RING-type E3 ubiquitin transferase n=1 Tax=Cuscuta europaea TaxID=41803 RepID=A0A9P0ZBR4_CUSEU|nr:unnamed protein product [Cuscuta europaea]